MKQPCLSVIIPTFNGQAFLPATLDSVLCQEDPDLECIVVDGGSTDATLSIVQVYEHRLPIRLEQRGEPSGWVSSTNYALSLARGEYICFLHQDDIWFRDRLSTLRGLIARSPQTVLFLHPSNYIDTGGNTLGPWSCPLPDSPRIIKPDFMLERLLVQNFISMPAPLFRSDIARRVGGLDEALWYAADWDFWLKIAACGEALYFPEPLSGFRVHPNSQTVVRSSNLADFREQLAIVSNKHLALWQASGRLKHRVGKVTKFSNEVNSTLAGMMYGRRPPLWHLLIWFLALGPSGAHRYLRDSRIRERVAARLKARLLTAPSG
jgi:glycosyltransferase involved in cell wall biosynthesis